MNLVSWIKKKVIFYVFTVLCELIIYVHGDSSAGSGIKVHGSFEYVIEIFCRLWTW